MASQSGQNGENSQDIPDMQENSGVMGGDHMKTLFDNMQQSRTYFVETHGCQMNVSDSEIVASILENSGYSQAEDMEQADVIMINTCAIREGAE